MGAYPFAVWRIYNDDGSQVFSSYDIRSDADRDEAIDILNNTKNFFGYNGLFYYDSGFVKYQNHEGEYRVFSSQTLARYIDFVVDASVDGSVLSMNIKGKLVIDYGDDTNARSNGYQNSTLTFNKTYTTAGTYTMRIYQSDIYAECDMIGITGNTQCKITDMSGSLSISLMNFDLRLHNMGATDLTPINSARTSLKNVTLFYCGITSVNNLFAINPQGTVLSGAAYFNWKLLLSFSLVGNALSVTEVNDFIIDAYNNLQKTFPRSMNTRQVPAAPPTSTALSNKNTLNTTYGWSFVTD